MNKKMILYGIMIILVLLLLLVSLGAIKINDGNKANSNSLNIGNYDNLPEKCVPEPGYTEESWLEHMGHHPDLYKECLA